MEGSAAVEKFPPQGWDHERFVVLRVPPILEEVEAVVQGAPHVHVGRHSFE